MSKNESVKASLDLYKGLIYTKTKELENLKERK